jgi:hypothetical protein
MRLLAEAAVSSLRHAGRGLSRTPAVPSSAMRLRKIDRFSGDV